MCDCVRVGDSPAMYKIYIFPVTLDAGNAKYLLYDITICTSRNQMIRISMRTGIWYGREPAGYYTGGASVRNITGGRRRLIPTVKLK